MLTGKNVLEQVADQLERDILERQGKRADEHADYFSTNLKYQSLERCFQASLLE